MRASKFIFIFILLFSINGYSKKVIKFSAEDLETETVLPIFPQREAVKNRFIQLTHRFEIGASVGSQLNQAYYNPLMIGFNTAFYFNEEHGLRFNFYTLSTDLSSNAEQLKKTDVVGSGNEFDASLAPAPSGYMSLDYEYNFIYGKIGFSKKKIFNLHTYASFGLGMMDFEGTNKASINFGLGEKIYLTKNIAVKADLNILIYQGPEIETKDPSLAPGEPKRSADEFETTIYINQTLMMGLVVIF